MYMHQINHKSLLINSINTICGVPSRLVCGVGNKGPELTPLPINSDLSMNATATAGAANDIATGSSGIISEKKKQKLH